ncbi:Anti-anti-sigma regulatory factor (antagonist of anti-sigma factor) [Mycobacterium numidiamassiliense]|uniref:Anti-sigma factor antagonist n=1 Tax=Mycobacterium numidiamassiliense TaxID=1841861 RepID=A0A2U3PFQ5_9MYCO|nr:anti-sigma factor antagonist [Mycobacterium numidiamassiliense]SPM42578.1 Anti-anti-sigma regulatory factor (antagonist of anti-sigma factor) [Mycobacterium numidiamassiliense]
MTDSASFGTSSPADSYIVSQDSDTQSGLRAITECTGSSVVVHVGGDIDASNQTIWQHLLSQGAARAVAPGLFVIDVRELDFMGSRGYAVLAHEAAQCRVRGIDLRLVTSQAIVARTIAKCGLRPLLPTYTTVETALAG